MKKQDATTTPSTTTTDLLERLAAARARRDAAADARNASRPQWQTLSPGQRFPGPSAGPKATLTRMQELELQIESLEAEDALKAAEVSASAALDAADRAEGDELAEHSDLSVLLSDLEAIEAESAAARARVIDLGNQYARRLNATIQAHARLAARRRSNNLPSPAPVPSSLQNGVGAHLQKLRDAIKSAGVPRRDNETQIAQLAGELRQLKLEAAKREKEREEERRAAAEWRQSAEQERARAAEQHRAGLLKSEAEAAARRAEEDKLLAEFDRQRSV